jgi:thymidylate kinase
MFIILEGVDGVGKTTLGKKLAERNNMSYVHFSAPANQQEADAQFEMYKKFLNDNNNIVIDRCWYSDQVYGPIFRGKATITPEQQAKLEEILVEKGCQIYYCYDTAANVIRRAFTRGEDFIKPEHVEALLEGYTKLIPQSTRAYRL